MNEKNVSISCGENHFMMLKGQNNFFLKKNFQKHF